MEMREGREMRIRSRVSTVVASMAWLVAVAAAAAAAAAPRGEAVPVSDAHRDWNELLRRHVRGGFVDYDGFQRDRSLLARYLSGLAPRPRAALQAPDEIALWINAYNAATIDLILRERAARGGRLRSIRDIPSAWSRPRWTILGEERTLDEIEHEILRKRFREPRIHAALVCASRSCPALRASAYQGAFLDAQLDSAARRFVLDPTRNRFRPEGGRVRLSRIFDWYGKDFVGSSRDSVLERRYGRERGAVLAFASKYLPAEDTRALRAARVRLEFLPYDWTLNSAGNAR